MKMSKRQKLKSLNKHNSKAWYNQVYMFSNKPKPNGISCPECGSELMDSNPMITLTSYPAKKNVHCNCGYKAYRIA
jgi:hypothetical protein